MSYFLPLYGMSFHLFGEKKNSLFCESLFVPVEISVTK